MCCRLAIQVLVTRTIRPIEANSGTLVDKYVV